MRGSSALEGLSPLRSASAAGMAIEVTNNETVKASNQRASALQGTVPVHVCGMMLAWFQWFAAFLPELRDDAKTATCEVGKVSAATTKPD